MPPRNSETSATFQPTILSKLINKHSSPLVFSLKYVRLAISIRNWTLFGHYLWWLTNSGLDHLLQTKPKNPRLIIIVISSFSLLSWILEVVWSGLLFDDSHFISPSKWIILIKASTSAQPQALHKTVESCGPRRILAAYSNICEGRRTVCSG